MDKVTFEFDGHMIELCVDEVRIWKQGSNPSAAVVLSAYQLQKALLTASMLVKVKSKSTFSQQLVNEGLNDAAI